MKDCRNTKYDLAREGIYIQNVDRLLQIQVYAACVLQVCAACGKSTLDSSICCMCIASICSMWKI